MQRGPSRPRWGATSGRAGGGDVLRATRPHLVERRAPRDVGAWSPERTEAGGNWRESGCARRRRARRSQSHPVACAAPRWGATSGRAGGGDVLRATRPHLVERRAPVILERGRPSAQKQAGTGGRADAPAADVPGGHSPTRWRVWTWRWSQTHPGCEMSAAVFWSLARASNFPTVWSNVLAGWLISGQSWHGGVWGGRSRAARWCMRAGAR